VKQRLAKELRQALQSFDKAFDTKHWQLKLWMTVMGGAAAMSTTDRHWYVLRICDQVTLGSLSWVKFRMLMLTFLWWDHVFEPRIADQWCEAYSLKQSVDSDNDP
jgi:hypothetical protein